MQWIIDGTIHLTTICTTAKWKWKDCTAALVLAGLSAADAQIFAGWAFGTDAVYQRAVSDECLSPANYARLSIAASTHGKHPICIQA